MNQHAFLTIANPTTSEFKDRGSKFYGFAYPVSTTDNVKQHIKILKDQHPKAIHFCFAYRLGVSQDVFRSSDDGEPSGSAGKPILAQIDSASLTNVLLVVIRYWGGVLLGVPGLINAYKTAAQEAISTADIVEKAIQIRYALEFNYTLMNDIMRVIKQFDVEVIHTDMGLFCTYEIAIQLKFLDEVLVQLDKFYELKINKL